MEALNRINSYLICLLLYQGSRFILQIPAHLWKIIQQNNGFDGITLKPAPTPNPDGSYTIKLTPQQWKIFQENQKKSPVAVPVPADETPDGAPDKNQISAKNDPRRFICSL